MSHVFENQPCEVIVDDILIWADSEHENLEKLCQVLQRAEEVGLRFNNENRSRVRRTRLQRRRGEA